MLIVGSMIAMVGVNKKHASILTSGILIALFPSMMLSWFAAGWSSEKDATKKANITMIVSSLVIFSISFMILQRV